MKRALSLVLAGTALAGAGPVLAEDLEPKAFATAFPSTTPKGFENLEEPMPVVVDIYFGGVLIGSTSGVQEPGYFTFDAPENVVALMRGVENPGSIIAALTGRLTSNAAFVCAPSTNEGCGSLTPQVAGIIHDPASFRVEIFVAQDLMTVVSLQDSGYLSVPNAGLSLISNITGSFAGVQGRTNYALQNRSIVSYRNARLQSELNQSEQFGFQTQILAGEVDAGRLRYRGGLMFSDPLAFTGQARIYGASVGSQFDTQADGDSVFSLPLVIFLSRRAQVNTYRDGRLLGSALYDAGNQTIDTSGFPAGAYNVTLEIVDDNGATRTEIRFFTKDRNLPPVGKGAFSLTAGALTLDRRDMLPEFGDDLFLQGTFGYRLGDRFAVEGGGLLVGSDFVLEGGASYLADGFTSRLVGLAGNQGNYGLIANFSWFDLRDVSVNGFLRRTWGPGFGELSTRNRLGLTPINDINLLVGESTQAGGNIGLRIGNANIRFDGLYFKSPNSDAFYSFGPSFDYTWRPVRNAKFLLFADSRRSNDRWDSRVGIRIDFLRNNLAVFSETAGAYRKRNGLGESGAIGNVLATYSNPSVLRGDLSLAAGYARDLDNDRVRAEANFGSQYGRFAGQAEHVFDTLNGSGTRYSANFATSLVAAGGDTTVGGSDVGDSGIVATLAGGAGDLVVDVLIDNTPRARLVSGQSLPIFLAPYRSYSVRIVPVSGQTARFDTRTREVSLYRGNMELLKWEVVLTRAVFGRLVDPAGKPVSNSVITGDFDFMQTDANGYFQGEIATGDRFVVRQQGRKICALRLVLPTKDVPLKRLGDVLCDITLPPNSERNQ